MDARPSTGRSGHLGLRHIQRLAPWLVLVAVVGIRAESSDRPSASADALTSVADDLAKQAYEILKTNCFECHGAPKRAGLDMRTPEALEAGGAKGRSSFRTSPRRAGSITTPSRARGPDAAAPDEKIAEDDLETLRTWIEAGGSLEGVKAAARRRSPPPSCRSPKTGRSSRPSASTGRSRRRCARAVPAAKTPGWNTNPIDAFLASAMEAKGLKPSAPADRRTLIRRVYLDVLGLPPTPEQVEAFVADKSPQAWAKVVDEVLASPHYGERWARHWMDLVRYADSEGFEFDNDRAADVPLSRLPGRRRSTRTSRTTSSSSEQLAGDEYAPRHRRGDDRDRVPAARSVGRRHAAGRARRSASRATTQTFIGLTVELRALPQPQVRSDPAEGLLPASSRSSSPTTAGEPSAGAAARGRRPTDARRSASTRCSVRCARRRRKIEAPYLQMIVDREIAKLPEYMQLAWKTPPDKRTPGQKLTVTQIERTVTHGGHDAQARDREPTSSR